MKSPRALVATAAVVAVLSGCDIPTGPPIIEQRWIIEVNETSLSYDDLLPSAVSMVGDDFEFSVDPNAGSETLGVLCGAACQAVDGTNAPVPAFDGQFTSTQSLPDDVLSAVVEEGSIDIQITNGFSFDPLQGGGLIVVRMEDGLTGTSLGEIVLDGAEETFPPNASETRTLSLAPGTVSTAIRTRTIVEVPGGQWADIDVSEVIEVVATTTSILASSVTVDVGNRSVSFVEQHLDFDDIDADITNRIVEGSIILAVTNPFGVALDGTIDIGATSKTFWVDGSGSSTATVPYTGDELRSFLGQPNMTFSGSGVANGTAVTIQPGQEMAVRATLDVTIEIG